MRVYLYLSNIQSQLSANLNVPFTFTESSLLFLLCRWHRWGHARAHTHAHTLYHQHIYFFGSTLASLLLVGLYAYILSHGVCTQRGYCCSSARLRMVRKHWSASIDDVTVTRLVLHCKTRAGVSGIVVQANTATCRKWSWTAALLGKQLLGKHHPLMCAFQTSTMRRRRARARMWCMTRERQPSTATPTSTSSSSSAHFMSWWPSPTGFSKWFLYGARHCCIHVDVSVALQDWQELFDEYLNPNCPETHFCCLLSVCACFSAACLCFSAVFIYLFILWMRQRSFSNLFWSFLFCCAELSDF